MAILIYKGAKAVWRRCWASEGVTPDTHTVVWHFGLVGQSGTGFTVTGTGDGDAFEFTAAASVTSGKTIGRYAWIAEATGISDSTDVRVMETGDAEVLAGAAAYATGDLPLSSAEQIVAALEATLLGSASADVLEYEISTPVGTKKIKKLARNEILELLKYYKRIVAAENAANRAKKTGVLTRAYKVRHRDFY